VTLISLAPVDSGPDLTRFDHSEYLGRRSHPSG